VAISTLARRVLPHFAAFSAVDAEMQNDFMVTGLAVARDQRQLSARPARRRLLVVRLDVEFEDQTE